MLWSLVSRSVYAVARMGPVVDGDYTTCVHRVASSVDPIWVDRICPNPAKGKHTASVLFCIAHRYNCRLTPPCSCAARPLPQVGISRKLLRNSDRRAAAVNFAKFRPLCTKIHLTCTKSRNFAPPCGRHTACRGVAASDQPGSAENHITQLMVFFFVTGCGSVSFFVPFT